MTWFDKAVCAYLEADKGAYHSPITYKNKRNFLGRLERFLNGRELCEQTAQEYKNSLPSRGISESSARSEIVWLRTFIKFCEENGFIAEPFVSRIKKPGVENDSPEIPLINLLTAEKVIQEGCKILTTDNQLARRVKADEKIALNLVLLVPLRYSEFSQLQGKDLYLDASPPVIMVRLKGKKSKKPRSVVLPKAAVDLLRPIAHRDRLFNISNSGCNRALARGMEALEIPFSITCHGLRHAVLNEEKRAGMPPLYIQQRANHSKFDTTVKYYLQNDSDSLKKAIDTYNPIARRALASKDKLNYCRDRIQEIIGNDPQLVLEEQDGCLRIVARD